MGEIYCTFGALEPGRGAGGDIEEIYIDHACLFIKNLNITQFSNALFFYPTAR